MRVGRPEKMLDNVGLVAKLEADLSEMSRNDLICSHLREKIETLRRDLDDLVNNSFTNELKFKIAMASRSTKEEGHHGDGDNKEEGHHGQ